MCVPRALVFIVVLIVVSPEQVRMWNIPDQQVVDWADVHEMVTAVNFAPEGAKAIVGTMKGKCRFYRCANFHLEYEAQIGTNQH